MVDSMASDVAKDVDLTPNPAFPKARLVERRDITEDLMVIRLEPEEGGTFPFKPGQYCTLGLGPIERAYSIASAPHEKELEVFVELVPVTPATAPSHGSGLVEHHVQDAGLVAPVRRRRPVSPRSAVAEEPVKRERGDDFLGRRRVRVSPRNVRSDDPRESASDVVDASPGGIHAKVNGRQRGVRPDATGDELIYRSAPGVDVPARGALDISAGQPSGNLRPVAVAADRIGVPEVLQQQNLALQGRQRLEMLLDRVVVPRTVREPLVRIHAAWHEQERKAQRRFCQLARPYGRSRGQGLQPRQRQADACTAPNRPAREGLSPGSTSLAPQSYHARRANRPLHSA